MLLLRLGGSLSKSIEQRRNSSKSFTEFELRRIATHLTKGLQYIHSKQLVHLDIKPDNIFLALEYLPSPASTPTDDDEDQLTRKKHHHSTDSGHASDSKQADSQQQLPIMLGVVPGNDSTNERIGYKLGDLGHVAQIHGDYIPEEGDCRYMAPELLLHDVDRERLPKVSTIYAIFVQSAEE